MDSDPSPAHGFGVDSWKQTNVLWCEVLIGASQLRQPRRKKQLMDCYWSSTYFIFYIKTQKTNKVKQLLWMTEWIWEFDGHKVRAMGVGSGSPGYEIHTFLKGSDIHLDITLTAMAESAVFSIINILQHSMLERGERRESWMGKKREWVKETEMWSRKSC